MEKNLAAKLAQMLKEAIETTQQTAKRSDSGVKDAESLLSQLKAIQVKPPAIKSLGWSKAAKEANAEETIVKKLGEAEKKGTRESCEEALDAIKGERKLQKIAKQLDTLLKKDEAVAKKAEEIVSKIKAEQAVLKKIEADLERAKF